MTDVEGDAITPPAANLVAAAVAKAHSLVELIETRYRPRDPSMVPPGYLRGIDAYEPDKIANVVANILFVHHRKTGRYPDLLAPELYSEKLNALKLLAPLKVPESGNKLLTGSFLTPETRRLLRLPEVVWHSTSAVLPRNSQIEAGEYYLKSNHGSDRCARIRYPLADAERLELEAKATEWLSTTFGLPLGEWWYNAFRRRLLLERCVSRRNPSAAMLFYVFRGRVGLISIDEKLLDGSDRTRSSLFDPEFRLLPDQGSGDEPLCDFSVSDDMKARALAAASAVGRDFEAVRVDIIPGDAGELYLNEITFTSNGGLPLKSHERDRAMGEMWGPCGFLR